MLVHGAWHGTWCWDYLRPVLEAVGWRTSTVDLPSTWGDPTVGMYDDARAVRKHLETIDGPVTVLAHAYGGVPVTEVAATVPNVTQLIYLAAHMLDFGEDIATSVGGPWFSPDARLLPPPEPTREILYNGLRGELADWAMGRLRPWQSARVFTDQQTVASWRTIPSALILCDQDKALPEVFAERQTSRATMVRHVTGGHCSFMSSPADLADIIDEVTGAEPAARR